ncbi:MAG: GTP-binding protein, partial [Candidatus Krumholzibacteria bacterium]|nr:GTP-binding protein [Candidatus Krumholzibacteria bacterium]
MKSYSIDHIRNVAFLGHQASGKTILGEAALFAGGVTTRIGRIEDGNTVFDHSQDEIERQISIYSSLAWLEHDRTKINIIDTPGYEDFVGEVLGAVSVVEGGVIVVGADAGVEIGTEKGWRYLDRRGLPRVVCINKMDKEHADFEKCLADVQKYLGAHVMPLTLPIGQGDSFAGIVDVIGKKALKAGAGGSFTEEEIPGDLAGAAREWHRKLMDFAAEADDSLLEKFLESGELSDAELRQGLSAGCRAGTFVPLVATSALTGGGVGQLLDVIVSMLPSPAWLAEVDAYDDSGAVKKIPVGPSEPTAGFVFKALSEKHLGDLSFIRVFSGEMKVGEDLYNATIENSERIGQ